MEHKYKIIYDIKYSGYICIRILKELNILIYFPVCC
jgi:hypothetical protein